MSKEEIANLCQSKGIGFKLIKGGIVVMDVTQLPGTVAALFDEKGFFTEEVKTPATVENIESEPATKRTKKDSK